MFAAMSSLLFFFAFASASITAQGFYANCSADWILGFGGYNQFMAASCPDHNGVLHASFIDIDDCVTNSEGVLSGKPRQVDDLSNNLFDPLVC